MSKNQEKTNIRELCKKLFWKDLPSLLNKETEKQALAALEAFAREIRREALEEAANKAMFHSNPPGMTFTEQDCCPVLARTIALEIRALALAANVKTKGVENEG